MSAGLLAAQAASSATDPPHLVANLLLLALGLVAAFFVLRPELWGRLWFARVDPRPAAIMRIGFGLALITTFVDYLPRARLLFTDEGLWLPSLARERFGAPLSYVWDPEHGFEHWWSLAYAVSGNFTVLHFRSDPPLVFALYAAMLLSMGLMVVGLWTRGATIVSWILLTQLYRYSPLFYSGADYVIQVFLFLGMFCRWGEAYSLDGWRRRRRLLLGGAMEFPPRPLIPAWPLRLMALQLACIYATSGLLKTGPLWRDGTALYYALNLDVFYRVPAQGLVTWLQRVGLLPLLTWLTRAWELLFPLVLVGALLAQYERERAAGVWPVAPRGRRLLSWLAAGAAWAAMAWASGMMVPAYLARHGLESADEARAAGTAVVALLPIAVAAPYLLARRRSPLLLAALLDWLLGKRLWLGFGVLVHLGIEASMNIGTFPGLMIASYACLLTGRDVDGVWRFVSSRALRPGEGGRPRRPTPWRWLLGPLDRLRYRASAPVYTILYQPAEVGVRRAALLRLWDPGGRLAFVPEAAPGPATLRVRSPVTPAILAGPEAAVALARVLPGLWWLRPLAALPPLRRPAGAVALRLLSQS